MPSSKKKTPVRINGFQRPYSDLQIATWVIYPVFLAGFYVLLLPVLLTGDLVVGVSLGAAYFLLHVWSARAAYVVTVTDPADPMLKATSKYSSAAARGKGGAIDVTTPRPPLHEACYAVDVAGEEEQGSQTSGGNNDDEEEGGAAECQPLPTVVGNVAMCAVGTCAGHPPLDPLTAPSTPSPSSANPPSNSGSGRQSVKETEFCYYCQIPVASASKHCRFCDKCVHRFDHHCKWLNNCVGSNNYRDFLGVLVSTLLFTALQLALSAHLGSAYFNNHGGGGGSGRVRERVNRLFGGGAGSTAWLALVLSLGVVLLVVVVLVAQLLHFHTVLLRNRQTTYEFVTEVQTNRRPKRKKKKSQKKKTAERPSSSKPIPKRNSDSRGEGKEAGGGTATTAAAAAESSTSPAEQSEQDTRKHEDVKGQGEEEEGTRGSDHNEHGGGGGDGGDLELGVVARPPQEGEGGGRDEAPHKNAGGEGGGSPAGSSSSSSSNNKNENKK